MSDSYVRAIVRKLTVSYTEVSPQEIETLLNSAAGTVTRLLGRPDWQMAVDLTRLRLDVRAYRAA